MAATLYTNRAACNRQLYEHDKVVSVPCCARGRCLLCCVLCCAVFCVACVLCVPRVVCVLRRHFGLTV